MHLFGTNTLCQTGGVGDITEKHRHPFVLTFHGGAAVEDALDEVLGRIAVRGTEATRG